MDFEQLKNQIKYTVIKDTEDTIHRITELKAKILKDEYEYGIEIDTFTNFNFSIYSYPSSRIDAFVLEGDERST